MADGKPTLAELLAGQVADAPRLVDERWRRICVDRRRGHGGLNYNNGGTVRGLFGDEAGMQGYHAKTGKNKEKESEGGPMSRAAGWSAAG